MEGIAEYRQKGTGNGALFRGMLILQTNRAKRLLLVFSLAVPCLAAPIALTAAPLGVQTGSQQPDCLSELVPQPVRVARVSDGDTLVLKDKRKVRLIGINTLELNEKHPGDRAWAHTATEALEKFIHNRQISIIPGIETHDRYGRLLAHVRTHDGRDASHELVSRGLAIAVAVGKNTRCASELLTRENRASRARLGLWASPGKWYLNANRLKGNEQGFHMVEARVLRLTGRGKRRALLLDNGMTAHLGKYWPAAGTSPQSPLDSIAGQDVKLKGWLGSSAGKTYMTLHHPANLQVIQH